MIRLYSYVGEVSEDQLDFLIDNLEEEWSEDRDYYINRPMIDMLRSKGADPALLKLLENSLSGQEDVEILWVDTDELEEEDDDANPSIMGPL
jgi:hypothetical protein